VLDKHLRKARDKVEAAEATVEALDAIHNRPIPEECAECDSALGGRWAEGDDGEPLCFDCAGIDESALS